MTKKDFRIERRGLAHNNFSFENEAELVDVVLIEKPEFEVEWGQRIFFCDWHVDLIGGEFSLIKWAASSMNPNGKKKNFRDLLE